MGNSSVTETEVRNNRGVHNGETGDVANTQRGRKPPGDCRYTSAEPSLMKIKASAGVPEGPCLIRISQQVSLPAAFRSISAMSLASSLVPAGPCPPSLVMSGTAFLRPVRSQLMKSEYDASTSIICP